MMVVVDNNLRVNSELGNYIVIVILSVAMNSTYEKQMERIIKDIIMMEEWVNIMKEWMRKCLLRD